MYAVSDSIGILSWAISIHRSHGITLDRVIVDIGQNEFRIGFSYVGFSRVKILEGLLIKTFFNFDRLLKINRSSATVGWREELDRYRNITDKTWFMKTINTIIKYHLWKNLLILHYLWISFILPYLPLHYNAGFAPLCPQDILTLKS